MLDAEYLLIDRGVASLINDYAKQKHDRGPICPRLAK